MLVHNKYFHKLVPSMKLSIHFSRAFLCAQQHRILIHCQVFSVLIENLAVYHGQYYIAALQRIDQVGFGMNIVVSYAAYLYSPKSNRRDILFSAYPDCCSQALFAPTLVAAAKACAGVITVGSSVVSFLQQRHKFEFFPQVQVIRCWQLRPCQGQCCIRLPAFC